jgi:hypothetical protein
MPPVIEPITAVIEVEYGDGDQTPRWRQFVRIEPRQLTAYAVPRDTPHVFGVVADPTKCEVLLCYTGAGLLRHIGTQTPARDFDFCPVLDELTGGATLYPSLRLIFRTAEDRKRMMRHIQNLCRPGAEPSPIREILRHLPAPPVVIDVYQPKPSPE